jgi:proteic killer suppression protein
MPTESTVQPEPCRPHMPDYGLPEGPEGLVHQAEMKLDQLEAATSLRDLAALPGNRLEALKGAREGQHSIRIHGQWRICFEWPHDSEGAINVELVD